MLPYRPLVAGLCLALGTACTGVIINPQDDDDGSPGSPSSSAGGSGGITGDAPTDPGTSVLRRLNRAEYNNTVRDLMGTTQRPADEFPDDDVSHGFDTIASTLSLSPLHLEQYEAAAEALVDELFARPAGDATRERVLSCAPDAADSACVRTILGNLATSAFRRAVVDAELEDYVGLVQLATTQGDDVVQGLRLALQAILMSPHFIFRVERDADPASAVPHRLNAYELATRVSYALWSSMPDPALFDAADSGQLLEAGSLASQVSRMLDDPKSLALVENFAGQWWMTRSLDAFTPDATTYPEFDDELRDSMRRETERFFEEFLREPLPLSRMLAADFSFVDPRLAAHYGLPAPGGFERVDLTGSNRTGLLTQGSFLLVTSLPTRPAPVKRGKWVLEQILCAAPPPPPPGVDTSLVEDEMEAQSVRERLEQHRRDPTCASCHRVMDPIGLGLERFDGIGAERASYDNGLSIDASGELPDVGPFDGARELSALLADDPRFEACVVEQFLTYALGRKLQGREDSAWIASIANNARGAGGTLRAVFEAAVLSDLFQTRRAQAEGSQP